MRLVVCDGCGRHVRPVAACPFCGGTRTHVPPTVRGRLARGAAVAAILGTTAACGARSDLGVPDVPDDDAADAAEHCDALVPIASYGVGPFVRDAGCK